MLTQFFPNKNVFSGIEEMLSSEFINQKPLIPFENIIISFLNEVSKEILTDIKINYNSELVALAYWLRKSNIEQIKSSFINNNYKTEVVVPRGIAFHIAPSNVDTIFLYSWSLSLLCGNINIIRISQSSNFIIESLIDVLNKVGANDEFSSITERNMILTYDHDDEINAKLSSIADIRVLWGGDKTIQNIRKFKTKPITKEICFADKVSYSLINSKELINQSEEQMSDLAKRFFNDSYFFDQMACSSPRFIYFSGVEADNQKASNELRKWIGIELTRRNKYDEVSIAMNKLVRIFDDAATGVDIKIQELPEYNLPCFVKIDIAESTDVRESCGGGFFYEIYIADISDIISYVQSSDQTLSYFGFTKDEMKDFAVKLNGSGLDRIVPVGQALNFMTVWDGYSLLLEFTKKVVVI